MKTLLRHWKRLLSWLKGSGRSYRQVRCTDAPETLEDRTIYLVGEGGHEWHLILTCPCRCGDAIYLNLLTEISPRWDYVIRQGEISVHPSVWRTKGCRSHFRIRKGDIVWV